MTAQKVLHDTIEHYKNLHKTTGIFNDRLHGGHFEDIKNRADGPIHHLVNHLVSKIEREKAGSASSGGFIPFAGKMDDELAKFKGGSAGTGGSLHTGGGFGPDMSLPQTQQEMYHALLMMSPHQLEMFREIAAQLLGGASSHMWGDLTDKKEPLETDAEEYENLVRMPNSHAAARMLEADVGGGGKFFKALKHVGKLATRVYSAGHAALKWVGNNKDLIVGLVPDQYKAGAEGFLETANKIDAAVNPIVDATVNALKDNATAEDKAKLKKMAKESIDKAVENNIPGAKKYIAAAEDAYKTVQEHRKKPVGTL